MFYLKTISLFFPPKKKKIVQKKESKQFIFQYLKTEKETPDLPYFALNTKFHPLTLDSIQF